MSGDLSDFSMFELFRQEIQGQGEILTREILVLERDPASRQVEPLMRASHSIKGAARIVGLDPIVGLAHVMESAFVAVGQGRITLAGEDVDHVLAAIDLFGELGGVSEDDMDGWLAGRAPSIARLVESISGITGELPPSTSRRMSRPAEFRKGPATGRAPDTARAPESERAPDTGKLPETFRGRETLRGPETESLPQPELPKVFGTSTAPALPVDPSLWNQFLREVRAQARRMEELLDAGGVPPLDDLLEAARSVRGAALLAGAEVAGRIGTILAERLTAAITSGRSLRPGELATVREAIGVLGVLAERGEVPASTCDDLDARLGERAPLDFGHVVQSEIENHALILTQGIQELHRDPTSTQRVQALRNAARAIGDGAQSLGVAPASALARALELALAAVEEGRHPLEAREVPILASAAEFLLAVVPRIGPARSMGPEDTQRLDGLVAEVRALVPVSRAVPAAAAVTAAATVTTPTAEPLSTVQPRRDRFVRITAENLERLMGLAGESMVQVNWLQPYADSLAALKRDQARIAAHLERLREMLATSDPRGPAVALVRTATKEHEASRDLLADRLIELEDYARRSVHLSHRLYREVLESRMRPFADGVQGFPRMVRDLTRQLGKRGELEIVGLQTEVDRDILDRLEAPLTHLLRNACDHGLETPEVRVAAGKHPSGLVRLEARHRAGLLSIQVVDDGRGIDLDRVREKVIEQGLSAVESAARFEEAELLEFLFLPGFSTAREVTEISGRGAGLDVVRDMVREVGGTVRISSQRGRGTTFNLELPLTLSVIRTLLVEIAGEPYAFPFTRIDQILRVEIDADRTVQGHPYVDWNGKALGLLSARQVLQLGEPLEEADEVPVVVISDERSRHGLVIDRILGEHELVVRPLDPRLGKVQDVSAAALLPDGSPVLILDVEDLLRSIDHLLAEGASTKVRRQVEAKTGRKKRVLVVDDSITVRELERRLLVHHGYEVETAVDGMDGWNTLRSGQFDLVVSDIDMPRMTGFEFIARIRAEPGHQRLPVVIVSYKDQPEDRRRGLEVGANRYLTKKDLDDERLIDAVIDLIGESA